MLDPDALIAQAEDPETARLLLTRLAARVAELQSQSDALLAENTLLKRAGSSGVSTDHLQRTRSDLVALRTYAARHGLDADTLLLLASTGEAVHLPGVAPMDQTLQLTPPAGGSLRDLRPLFVLAGTRLSESIVMTSAFRLMPLSGLAAPMSEASRWADARRALLLPRGERVDALCSAERVAAPKSLLVVSRTGWTRAIPWTTVDNLLATGQPLTPPDKDDSPVWIDVVDRDDADLLLLSRMGHWTRFPLSSLEPPGSMAVLPQNDDIACACVIAPGDNAILFAAADGAQFIAAETALPAHKRHGGKMQVLRRDWVSLLCVPVTARHASLILAANGDIAVSSLRGLPAAGRLSEARPLNTLGQRALTATVIYP
jgi:hypothetical protein